MRKKHEEAEESKAEAWAVPYADLLTLMLAFFVVMYSLSQINKSKYRVLAVALYQAFNGTGRVIQPVSPSRPKRKVPLPNKATPANARPMSMIKVPVPPQHLPIPGHEGAAAKPTNGTAIDAANLQAMSDAIAKALKPWVDSGKVTIRKAKSWLEIEIRTDVLFPSGVASLSTPARKVLDGVASVLARYPNPIRIEGFTDSQPIDTTKFPSNWELSAARAGSVARLMGEHGVKPNRMGIFGWSQYHPVAPNTTAQGRKRNRRIAIVVLSRGGGQHKVRDASFASMVAQAARRPSVERATAKTVAPKVTPPITHAPTTRAGVSAAGAVPTAAGVAAAPRVATPRPK